MPACSAATCGQPDGCGGTCGACPTETPCPDCRLTLHAQEKSFGKSGALRSVIFAVQWQPGSAPAPVLADVRVRLQGPATITRVGVGTAILDAGKELRPDGVTGAPFRDLGDGICQILVYSPGRHDPIGAGDWLYLDVAVDPGRAPLTSPIVASLVAREDILAPRAADESLWGSAISTPLVLWAQ